MRKTTRYNLLETNSSSAHTLVYKNRKLSKPKLPISKKTGMVIGHLGNFGKDTKEYEKQPDKLSYLLTCIAYNCGAYDGDTDRLYDDYYFQDLADVISEYTGAVGLEVPDGETGYIDHQSVPEWSGECDLFTLTKENMKNFIFDDNVILRTDCD